MSTELLRNELASSIGFLPPDQIQGVLSAFDRASSGYDIERKKLDLIPLDGIPEAVKHFIASKAIANCSPKSVAQYRYKLINFFNEVRKPFTDITTNDIRIYLYNYKETHKVSDHTAEHTRSILFNFFQWCVDNEYLIRVHRLTSRISIG